MLTSTLRIIIAIVLSAHGIGHVLGLLAALGIKPTPSHLARSWLLTNLLGAATSRVLVFVIFLAATLGFVSAGLGMFDWLVPGSMWQQLAIGSSVLSLMGLTLFLNAFPSIFPNWIGANAVNVAVLVSLLWLRWPPEIVGG